MNKKPLIYLASPHSHPDVGVREYRYREALKCLSWMFENNFHVFSPIVHCHNLPMNQDSNRSFENWKEYDTEMITRCDELWVLMLSGTKESVGVKAEIKIAKLQGKEIIAIAERKSDNTYSTYNITELTIEQFEFMPKTKEDAQAK